MNRQECHLFLTVGSGPVECRIALGKLIDMIIEEAKASLIACSIHNADNIDNYGPPSAIMTLEGENTFAFAHQYTGTIRFTFASPVRPNHKRKNWYVGVNLVENSAEDPLISIAPSEIRIDTMRAGGPGGQHQNTTDSAVRITHLPTGIKVISRDERSQHRNKAKAMQKLQLMLELLQTGKAEKLKQDMAQLHRTLVRGNEKRHIR